MESNSVYFFIWLLSLNITSIKFVRAAGNVSYLSFIQCASHSRNIPHCVCQCCVDRPSVLATTNNVAINILAHVFLPLIGRELPVIAGQPVLKFNFRRYNMYRQMVFQSSPISLPPAGQGTTVIQLPANHCSCGYCAGNHSGRYGHIVVPFPFLLWLRIWRHFFICSWPLRPPMKCLWKARFFVLSSIGSSAFFLPSCESSLYILDRGP